MPEDRIYIKLQQSCGLYVDGEAVGTYFGRYDREAVGTHFGRYDREAVGTHFGRYVANYYWQSTAEDGVTFDS